MTWVCIAAGAGGSAGIPPRNRYFFLLCAGGCAWVDACFHEPEDVPDESAELPRDCDGDFVALLAPGEQLHHALVQARLCFPRAGFDCFAESFLPGAQFFAHFGREPVVVGGFDE